MSWSRQHAPLTCEPCMNESIQRTTLPTNQALSAQQRMKAFCVLHPTQITNHQSRRRLMGNEAETRMWEERVCRLEGRLAAAEERRFPVMALRLAAASARYLSPSPTTQRLH